MRTVDTPLGAAGVLATASPGSPRGTLVLGHGAGGGSDSADLLAVAAAAAGAGWRVLRVEQPWRLAGRRVAAPAVHLDVAWRAVLAVLRESGDLEPPLVLGGRSAGARVACRTADEEGAAGVLALAFPLHPPGRPERSRGGELLAARVPVLVIQGERDPFGRPAEVEAAVRGAPGIEVRTVPGDHGLKKDPTAVADAALAWLSGCGAG